MPKDVIDKLTTFLESNDLEHMTILSKKLEKEARKRMLSRYYFKFFEYIQQDFPKHLKDVVQKIKISGTIELALNNYYQIFDSVKTLKIDGIDAIDAGVFVIQYPIKNLLISQCHIRDGIKFRNINGITNIEQVNFQNCIIDVPLVFPNDLKFLEFYECHRTDNENIEFNVPTQLVSFKTEDTPTNVKLSDLPETLETLQAVIDLESTIYETLKFPSNLKVLQLLEYDNFRNKFEIPSQLEELILPVNYPNFKLKFPDTLKRLDLGDDSQFNQLFNIPPYLEALSVNSEFNQPLEFPKSLKVLHIDSYRYDYPLNLPENLQKFSSWIQYYEHEIFLPDSVLHAHFNFPTKNIIHLGKNIRKFSVGSIVLPGSQKIMFYKSDKLITISVPVEMNLE
jgi:hypothetical protein